jgi:hypothetical protein
MRWDRANDRIVTSSTARANLELSDRIGRLLAPPRTSAIYRSPKLRQNHSALHPLADAKSGGPRLRRRLNTPSTPFTQELRYATSTIQIGRSPTPRAAL